MLWPLLVAAASAAIRIGGALSATGKFGTTGTQMKQAVCGARSGAISKVTTVGRDGPFRFGLPCQRSLQIGDTANDNQREQESN